MGNERQIKKVETVYTEIIKRLVDPSWRFPQGGLAIKCLQTFLDSFIQKCGGVLNNERLVDFCVCQAHTFKDFDLKGKWKPAHSFGPNALKRYDTAAHGKRYYEDEWLKSQQLTRKYLYNLIADKKEHPQAKFIYMPSEEVTKSRFINTDTGYFLCQTSTLGWSPLSESCQKCKKAESCKKETSKRLPELYRIRIEYGQRN